MNWFNKLPNINTNNKPVASGLEWTLWLKLPLITVAGTLLPLAVLAPVYLWQGESPGPEAARSLLMMVYVVAGVVLFHWSMVITVGIGCLIVMVMKGPGYVADGYLLPHSDQPRTAFETIEEAKADRPVTLPD